jgi:hypothetical protein
MNGAMVRATRAGTKTRTRRVVKLNQLAGSYFEGGAAGVEFDGFRIPRDSGPAPARFSAEAVGGGAHISEELNCPYGQPGGRIWVRETFYAYGRWVTRYSEKKRRDEWHFIDMTVECDRAYQYEADSPDMPLAKGRGGMLPGWYKRPAIFMPRAACRIVLEIAGVRVERLNDCSEADALAEGIDAGKLAERQDSYDIVCKGTGTVAARPRTPAEAACWCSTCRPVTLDDCRMVLCPTCGNKRCPQANDHNLACSGSNEPGQPGSAYPRWRAKGGV